MPIPITCPGCHQRFSVSEKFAGQKGPCPKCKAVIEIPKLEEQVVIHAPAETSGPRDAKGRAVLKTTKRTDARFNPTIAGAVGGVSLLTLLASFLLRSSPLAQTPAVLGVGGAVLGPLLAWSGYSFLRDQELEPYRGGALWLRATVCGLGYAGLWGLYALLGYLLGGDPEWAAKGLEVFQLLVIAGAVVGVGTFLGYVTLDLEPASAGMHCAFYFAVTVLLRWIMALPPLPGLQT